MIKSIGVRFVTEEQVAKLLDEEGAIGNLINLIICETEEAAAECQKAYDAGELTVMPKPSVREEFNQGVEAHLRETTLEFLEKPRTLLGVAYRHPLIVGMSEARSILNGLIDDGRVVRRRGRYYLKGR